jgi:putative ABC transport system permease protein
LKAINCNCAADPKGLATIREQIARLLPNTKVREHMGKMVVRAESRAEVAKQADRDLEREKAARSELRAKRQAFNAVLVPLVAVVAAVWLGLMMWDNARHRRGEIAILRAIGIRNGQILTLVLTKALAIGLLGALAGFTAGISIAVARSKTATGITGLFDPGILAGCLLGTVFLAVVASWLPAMLAAQTDPAVVLQKE